VEADINDAAALTAAFKGAAGVFVLVTQNFDPLPDFREARAIAAVLRSALDAASPGRVVSLSTIGAQATRPNLLTQHSIIERVLGGAIPICFLRPGWFMENSSWDIAPAAKNGVFLSFLQPLDKPVPVPRETWESLFQSQGMKNPSPRIQMLDGFNEGWIEFEGGEDGSRKGRVELRTVFQQLIERASRS
jgi:NAD(P)H dehydrogenase (quinone)